MLRLQPLVAGVDARHEDVNASLMHRSRPLTQSISGNVLDINVIAFGIVVSVAILNAATAVFDAVVMVGAAAAVIIALLMLLLLFLLLLLVV